MESKQLMKMFWTGLIALLVGLLFGFVPTWMKLRDTQAQQAASEQRLIAELDRARGKLTISDVHSQLGLLLVETRRGEFDEARRRSTRLFDAVARAVNEVEEPDARRRLMTIANARDEVTSALARGDERAAVSIERLFELLAGSL